MDDDPAATAAITAVIRIEKLPKLVPWRRWRIAAALLLIPWMLLLPSTATVRYCCC